MLAELTLDQITLLDVFISFVYSLSLRWLLLFSYSTLSVSGEFSSILEVNYFQLIIIHIKSNNQINNFHPYLRLVQNKKNLESGGNKQLRIRIKKIAKSYIRYPEIITMASQPNHQVKQQQSTKANSFPSQSQPNNHTIQAVRPTEQQTIKNQGDDFQNSRNKIENQGCKKLQPVSDGDSSQKIQQSKEEGSTPKIQQKKIQVSKQKTQSKKDHPQKVNQGQNLLSSQPNPNQNRAFRKGQLIVNQKKQIQYRAIELIGTGTFGQVLSVNSLMRNPQGGVTQHLMALKVIKNQPAYTNQGLMEIKNLRQISKYEQLLKESSKNYLQIYDGFMWEGHLCIAMELLDNNILNILETSGYKGIEMKWIEKWTKQILICLAKIHKIGIIHCDIKPENIMFRPQQPDKPILIDFSSSCSNGSQMFTYIQSRFYRSPEVLLAMKPYTEKVDMWSLGCVLAEMYLGLPIFPGGSAYDQLTKIFKVLQKTFDQQTIEMIRNSQQGHSYFWVKEKPIQIQQQFKEEEQASQQQLNNMDFIEFKEKGRSSEQKFEVNLKTYKQFKGHEKLQGKFEKVQINQNYFNMDSIDDMISFRNPPGKDIQTHELFIDLVKKMLVFNPSDRISAEQAFLHPFVGGIYAELETVRNLEDLLEEAKIKLQAKS